MTKNGDRKTGKYLFLGEWKITPPFLTNGKTECPLEAIKNSIEKTFE
jgi:hypothetical protein